MFICVDSKGKSKMDGEVICGFIVSFWELYFFRKEINGVVLFRNVWFFYLYICLDGIEVNLWLWFGGGIVNC